MNSLLIQLGISGPLVLALIAYTAARREEGLVHRYVAWLLGMGLAWMVGMVFEFSDQPTLRALAPLLVFPPTCFMSPLFCIMMLMYARVEVFELHRSARMALLAPFWLYLFVFATDAWHGQIGQVVPTVGAEPGARPGPLFWSFQICSTAVAFWGLGVTARIAWKSPSPEERRRMILLCFGAFIPTLVHAFYTLQWVPHEVPLTPASLSVTSLLVVAAIRRYRLLDVQPIARRDVIEASGDAVLIADSTGRVVDLNPIAASLLRAPRAWLVGRSLDEVLSALGAVEPADGLGTLLTASAAGETPTAEVETAEGCILEASSGRVGASQGEPAGTFVVLRDRTKERRAERMLQQSQRLESVGILAAGVAHEVNNPLAFVRANLAHVCQVAEQLGQREHELPKDLAESTHDLSEVLDETLVGLDRIQGTVQGLLRLSRTASDRVVTCPLNGIVDEAVRFASLDRDGGLRLEVQLAPDLPPVEAAPDQLVQVLLNLILNARRALAEREGGRILVSSRARGEWVEVRVADDGPGVPEALRERIFDPFFTTRPPNEGTGLGLPIAFDIVSEHGGSLTLESPAEGGAAFVVRLPAAPTPGA